MRIYQILQIKNKMDERNIFEKILNPTQEEIKNFKIKQERSFAIAKSLEKEGYSKTKQLIKEEEALDQGVPEEEVRKMASDFDKKALMPKIEKFIKNPIDTISSSLKKTFTKEPKIEQISRDLGLPPESENEVSISDSIGAAINSGIIKIPKGVINFGTLVYDAMQEEGIPIERGATYKFNRAFENSYLGLIEKQSEEMARETAVGRLTETFVQLLGGGKIAKELFIPTITKLSKKARELSPSLVSSIKTNKYLNTTKNTENIVNTTNKVNQLNKLSKVDKFVGITIGGGLGVGIVASEEDIGTFGDFIDFIPTKLDREKKESTKEDAGRQLHNKLLFGLEYSFPIIPAVYGLGKTGLLIAKNGKDLAFSNSLIYRWTDKFAKQFRSRGAMSQEIFEGVQKLEGKRSSINFQAKE